MGVRENIRNWVKVCSKEDVIIWARFWKLEIVGFDRDKRNRPTILYKCDCWKEWSTYLYNITRWKQSCWCDQYINNAEQAYKHGMWWTRKKWGRSRFYTCYYNIINRTKFHRWRSACYEWVKCLRESFENFYNDMYPSYLEFVKEHWEKNTTIDRINPNWDYCKENCRWATIKEQWYNKRTTVKAIINWVEKNSGDIMEELWVSRNTAIKYLHKNNELNPLLK